MPRINVKDLRELLAIAQKAAWITQHQNRAAAIQIRPELLTELAKLIDAHDDPQVTGYAISILREYDYDKYVGGGWLSIWRDEMASGQKVNKMPTVFPVLAKTILQLDDGIYFVPRNRETIRLRELRRLVNAVADLLEFSRDRDEIRFLPSDEGVDDWHNTIGSLVLEHFREELLEILPQGKWGLVVHYDTLVTEDELDSPGEEIADF